MIEGPASAEEFSLPLRVYIEDTDAGGIVYYVNYLKYMERARTEFMRVLGHDRAGIFHEGLMFVVREARVTYHAAARLDDALRVSARVAGLRGAQVVFVQQVERGGDGVLLASAEIVVVSVDPQTLRPRRMPAVLLQSLREAVNP